MLTGASHPDLRITLVLPDPARSMCEQPCGQIVFTRAASGAGNDRVVPLRIAEAMELGRDYCWAEGAPA